MACPSATPQAVHACLRASTCSSFSDPSEDANRKLQKPFFHLAEQPERTRGASCLRIHHAYAAMDIRQD